MMPQIAAKEQSDSARKDTLISFGFRLTSSKPHHPLTLREFGQIKPQEIFVSATPGEHELRASDGRVLEQVMRPTGLLAPVVEVCSKADATENLLGRSGLGSTRAIMGSSPRSPRRAFQKLAVLIIALCAPL